MISRMDRFEVVHAQWRAVRPSWKIWAGQRVMRRTMRTSWVSSRERTKQQRWDLLIQWYLTSSFLFKFFGSAFNNDLSNPFWPTRWRYRWRSVWVYRTCAALVSLQRYCSPSIAALCTVIFVDIVSRKKKLLQVCRSTILGCKVLSMKYTAMLRMDHINNDCDAVRWSRFDSIAPLVIWYNDVEYLPALDKFSQHASEYLVPWSPSGMAPTFSSHVHIYHPWPVASFLFSLHNM